MLATAQNNTVSFELVFHKAGCVPMNDNHDDFVYFMISNCQKKNDTIMEGSVSLVYGLDHGARRYSTCVFIMLRLCVDHSCFSQQIFEIMTILLFFLFLPKTPSNAQRRANQAHGLLFVMCTSKSHLIMN